MATDRNTLKTWFLRGSKPLAAQFAAWIDSYWHKDDKLPIASVDELAEALAEKLDANAVVTNEYYGATITSSNGTVEVADTIRNEVQQDNGIKIINQVFDISVPAINTIETTLDEAQQTIADNYAILSNQIAGLDKDHYVGEYDFGKYLDQQSEDDQALITAQAKILIWGADDAPNHADTEIFAKSYLVNTYNGTRREWILDNDQTTTPPSFWWSMRTESSFPVVTDTESYDALPVSTIYVEGR